jgi:sec-independent protein translocase protein TatA
MFGLGIPELIVICVIALLVFGPKRLPDAGRAIGEAIRGFKSSVDGKTEENRAGGPVAPANACSGCGKSLEPGTAFCPSCGRAQKERAA